MKREFKIGCGILGGLAAFLIAHSCYVNLVVEPGLRLRNTLAFALDLPVLPPSVSIEAHASELRTDFIYHFACRLDPEEFPKLLEGREFERADDQRLVKGVKRHEGYVSHLPSIDVFYQFDWNGENADCTVYSNEGFDEVYVAFRED